MTPPYMNITLCYIGHSSKAALALCLLLVAPTLCLARQPEAVNIAAEVDKILLEHTVATLQLARDKVELRASDSQAYNKLVRDSLDAWIDFRGFSRGVMGSFYKSARPEQFNAFVEKFQRSIVHIYVGVLDQINVGGIRLDPGIAYKRVPIRAGAKQRPGGIRKIRVALIAPIKGGAIYPFQYSAVRLKSGQWRVRNLIINGINLGLIYRNQFASLMADPAHKGDLDLVIQNWDAEVTAFQPAAP